MILNLSDLEKSDIKYVISKFPDGQQSVTISDPYLNSETPVVIRSRMNSFKDIELIICANQALRNIGITYISLYVPYFLGARSDRKFSEGGVNYLKDVICPIINSQEFKNVIVLDPHSDVLEACLKNFQKGNNHKLVKWSLEKIDNKNNARERVMLISPDAGAMKKMFDVAKEFKITNVITASKIRDISTSHILGTILPDADWTGIEHAVIIDDIGDGFGTFISLSKIIKENNPNVKIYLIVTHSIQKIGIENALKHFDKIYTTNSINDWDIENLLVLDVI
jgi:ribose-phosphate pyrophosphokinase